MFEVPFAEFYRQIPAGAIGTDSGVGRRNLEFAHFLHHLFEVDHRSDATGGALLRDLDEAVVGGDQQAAVRVEAAWVTPCRVVPTAGCVGG